MKTFEELQLKTPLKNGLDDLGFQTMTPIQEEAFPAIVSGRDMIGIAQTGTGSPTRNSYLVKASNFLAISSA